MDIPRPSTTLVIAIWGAVLATVIAVRDFRRTRTRFGVDIWTHFRMGGGPGSWEWIALEVTFRNASDRGTSVVEYSLHVPMAGREEAHAVPVRYGQIETGETLLIDPASQERVALRDLALPALPTPVNLPARSSVSGWIAFHFRRPISDDALSNGRAVLRVVDIEKRQWFADFVLGISLPWSRGAQVAGICPFDPPPLIDPEREPWPRKRRGLRRLRSSHRA